MERTGKSILPFLFAFLLSLSQVWAAAGAGWKPQQDGNPDPGKGYHVVEKGDTYYGLSRRYQVPVDSLRRWNGESLQLGTRVRVSFAASKKIAAAKAPAAAKPKTALADTPAAKPAAGNKASVKPQPVQPVKALPVAGNTRSQYTGPPEYAPEKKEAQRVLVIPFDPYLYFSDADNDIARQSNIPRQNVRAIFRSRLNAFMDPKGFESINLLGEPFRADQSELERIYKSVTYQYQPITQSKFNPTPVVEKTGSGPMAWVQRQKEKFAAPTAPEAAGNTSVARDPGKYYGAKVKDPDLYRHFNETYAVDYYLFINQFEIHTDYTNCIDRTQNDFTREFLVHYTLFDKQGTLIAGNKVRVPYISHVNDIEKIIRDNLNKMAQRILGDLPQPDKQLSVNSDQ
jgi:murein DD-endopeptidase MepM/ murein hydrolase activator NlpD